jgi:hypothetical protein
MSAKLKISRSKIFSGGKYFTITELLVVIAIISILMTVLLPALSKAKQVAKKIGCLNNLKHIGVMIGSYEDGAIPTFCQTNGKTWDVQLAEAYGISFKYETPSCRFPVLECPLDNGGGYKVAAGYVQERSYLLNAGEGKKLNGDYWWVGTGVANPYNGSVVLDRMIPSSGGTPGQLALLTDYYTDKTSPSPSGNGKTEHDDWVTYYGYFGRGVDGATKTYEKFRSSYGSAWAVIYGNGNMGHPDLSKTVLFQDLHAENLSAKEATAAYWDKLFRWRLR